METYRLKNIAILILVLLNVCLLLLVISLQYAQHQTQKNLISQTVTLLAGSDISVDPQLLEGKAPLYAYYYSRDAEAEETFAAALLGGSPVRRDAGGGTSVYTASAGTATFRANGSFSLEIDAPALQDGPGREFVETYCPANYRYEGLRTAGQHCTVTASAQVDGLPVYGATIVFSFTDDLLTSASGFFVPASELSSEPIETISRASAAVYLMDHCNEEGKICNTISGISDGYLLQSTVSAPMMLVPAYRIDTNTYSYYVNSSTGHVTPAGSSAR